ncbi:threonine-phosphate decarboxylase CobD [Natroniella sulfidigena]|uniref:threonine-phosphate decarboxylase CobD n=1 Tax=Natroniella sulfidigena TaxID=723921 RepID=UPI00200AE014|nr:threonine-phosphate decarboxylase CobD [Natroniella sulfidigena]MCK8817383.1 threonine-phosphate decarboxylase CobD [Natroniella sulfidigena]
MSQEKHGGNLNQAVKEYGLEQEEIIDFSANINFLGPPSKVMEAIKDNLDQIVNYPDPNCTELKDKLAEQLGVKQEEIIIGNGAVELVYLLAKVLQPQRALVLAPTFSEYGAAVRSVGANIEEFKLSRDDEFEIDLERLIVKLAEVDLFFLCNPNNPTGKLITRSEIIEIIEAGQQHDTFIMVDEAFVDFLEEEVTVIDLVDQYDNLFVLRSLTKFFAIPGLRLGYGVSNSSLLEELERGKDPWNCNFFAQLAGQIALNDQEYITRTKEAIKREKEFLYHNLKEVAGWKVYYPTANYILIDLSSLSITASELEEMLARQGILIRNCNTYTGLGEDFIRVAVKSRVENKNLIDNLVEVINE